MLKRYWFYEGKKLTGMESEYQNWLLIRNKKDNLKNTDRYSKLRSISVVIFTPKRIK